jgi:RNA polymerase sigma-70 factor, ECF subfamily
MQLVIGEETVSTVPKELEAIFAEHHSMVFRSAYRVTGNIADAEDVLQTVFLRLARRDLKMDNPAGYLRRSAVNAALDVVRGRHDSSVVELDRLPGRAQHEQGEIRENLRRALAMLPERTAEMFTLRFFEGMTNPEVARAMGLSQMVVAVTLHRTRRKLQKILRPGA